jgi:hypothetical protein
VAVPQTSKVLGRAPATAGRPSQYSVSSSPAATLLMQAMERWRVPPPQVAEHADHAAAFQ